MIVLKTSFKESNSSNQKDQFYIKKRNSKKRTNNCTKEKYHKKYKNEVNKSTST